MVSTPFTLTEAWNETNSYTAAESCAALLSNSSASDIRWARTPESAAPAIAPAQAHLLRPGNSLSVPLEPGERLWMVSNPQGQSVIDVFAQAEESGSAALTSRAELVTMAAQEPRPDGEEIRVGVLGYVWTAGATAIPDLPGLLPLQTVTLEHFGAVGDGVANDHLEDLGGGVIQGGLGRSYAITETTIASGVVFRGFGPGATMLKAPDTAYGAVWIRNRDVNNDTAPRTASNIGIENCTLDGSGISYVRWLSRADGSPITSPEEDYLMGTGDLASGIADVDLTAVVTDGVVTDITINNGGSGCPVPGQPVP